jgi:UDP-2,3-diacylglucosamine pyrophosphatase LpxH
MSPPVILGHSPAMFSHEFDLANPERVILGAWNNSSSLLLACDHAVKQGSEMTS